MRSHRDEYPVLGEAPNIDLPPRSVLYRLEPIGLGTSKRESLVSYLDRLMWAHRVSRFNLKALPGVGAAHEADLRLRDFDRAPAFLAGGVISLRWVTLLEELTTYKGLEALTFAPIARIVNTWRLVARTRRWCPECMSEAMAAGVPYAQLLWHVACVSACPIHQVALEQSCRCGGSPSRLRAAITPGHCPRCGAALADTLRRRKATSQEVQIARIVAVLLSEPRWDQGGWCPSDNHTTTFLRAAVDSHFGGKWTRLAKALGVAKSSLHVWMNGHSKPSLPWLVDLARHFECSVVSIVGGCHPTSRSAEGTRVHKRHRRRPKVSAKDRALIAEQLVKILASDTAEPLKKVAHRLDVDPKYLRENFPAEAALIVRRYYDQREAEKHDKRQQWLITVRKRAEELADAGVLPTSRRVLGDDTPPASYRKMRAEINQILAEARRRMATKAS